MVWTYREIEKLILEGGEEAFDELHEKKKQLLKKHIKVLSEHVEQLEKKRKKLMKLKKEIEEELERLDDELRYIDKYILNNHRHKELRVTIIDDVLLDKAINEIKVAEKVALKATAALCRVEMERPHWAIRMYYETYEKGSREILKRIHNKYAKKTLDGFFKCRRGA